MDLSDVHDHLARMLACVLPLLLAGVCSLIFVCVVNVRLLSRKTGRHIGQPQLDYYAERVRSGSLAFLQVEYGYLVVYVTAWSILVFIVFTARPVVDGAVTDGIRMAFCLSAGATLSALAGWTGMTMATEGNVRTTVACAIGTAGDGLEVAFATGSVVSFSVVGLASVGVSVVLLLMTPDRSQAQAVKYLHAFGFGASSIALFARVAGGIYTKAADIGADLVGKVEAGIDEDDPHNPAVIADNVGDNVGDVAGMSADLFESLVGSLIGACTLAGGDARRIALPLWLAAAGLVSSLVGFCFVSGKQEQLGLHKNVAGLMMALERGVYVANVLFFTLSMGATVALFGASSEEGWQCFVCTWLGLLSGMAISKGTEFFTSFEFGPTISIKDRARTGPATVIIQGLGVGMVSTCLPTVVLVATIVSCNALSGQYGISIAAVGMLGTLAISLSTDAFGPVADNAGGLAEMARLGPEVRAKTDILDAIGNTTAAMGKGFAVGSAVLTSLSLLAAVQQEVTRKREMLFELTSPVLLAGMLLGAMLPFLFAALTMMSVAKAAAQMIDEVRRQFREVRNEKGITLLEAIRRVSECGTIAEEDDVEPDSDKCIVIATRASVQEMMAPGTYAVLTPLLVGFLVGPRMLVGLLGGSIGSAAMLAMTMGTAGGAWDNAKKLCEKLQITRSDQGKACVVGDTVGDPFKDTSGPSLDILLKLMAMVALLIAPLVDGHKDWEEYWVGLIVMVVLILATCWLISKRILAWADPLDDVAIAPEGALERSPPPPCTEPAPEELGAVRFTKVQSFSKIDELPPVRINGWAGPARDTECPVDLQ